MTTWLLDNWTALASLPVVGGLVAALAKGGPRCLRRAIAMLDCEVDRLRWEEADKLRNREIALLRLDVANLQADLARLLDRSAASGAGSGAARDPATAATIPPRASGT